MNTATRLSVCLLGLASLALALPATKGWSTRYHVVKNFGADSSMVSLRFDSTWKSNDSLLARCMVKDSSLTTKSVQRDTAILMTNTSGKQTWSDYSCLFPWEPGGLHNWEDSKEDLGKLTIRCTQEVTPPDRPVIGGSGNYRGLATGFTVVRDASPVLTIWDSGARAWSLLRDNTFGQEWRRLEPPIGPLQKNWEIGEAVPGFVPLTPGDTWKWEISTLRTTDSCIWSMLTTCMERKKLIVDSFSQSLSVSIVEKLPDVGYFQKWNLEVNGLRSNQSWTSKCQYTSHVFGVIDTLRCNEPSTDWVSSTRRILTAHRIDGWEIQGDTDRFLRRVDSRGGSCLLGCEPIRKLTETLTPEIDLDRFDSSYSEPFWPNKAFTRTIQLMEKNGQTIRSTAIQPARRAASPLQNALSPEQFHRALQQMPQVRELQIVGITGARQTVPVGQFLSWSERHRGVHWISYAGAPCALQLLVP